MQTTPIIFRCDASSEVGWGFFRRSYALAEIAQQSTRFRVYFVSKPLHKSLKKKLTEIHATSQILENASSVEEDLAATHSLFDLMSRKKIVVVVDNKDWTSECFDALKQDKRIILIAVDHGQSRRYNCDILVNPGLGAEELSYETNDDCVRLLGPKYALIREEIHTLRQHPTERMADSFQFLVSLGAGDRWGYTIKAIEAVRKSQQRFETHIVVTADWPHTEAAKKLIGNHPRIHLYEDPSFFPQLLARADLALCTAGNTTYELAYLGVPMMTVSLDPLHDNVGLSWAKSNIGEHLGRGEALTSDLVLEKLEYWMQRDQELEERGVRSQAIIDGRGKFRILERLSKILYQDSSS
ncbi:MAG: UDP-2,4-diacetamido-2,4,6-trideoxy-beta-L-altropyranose hydrolase [Bdellovibrionota bacterium]